MKLTSIHCISDLHGFFPELPGGDLLIIAGDITGRNTLTEWIAFFGWLQRQKYKKKILVGGNHDNFLYDCYPKNPEKFDQVKLKFDYLCDSGTEFEGLKIWGTPWTRTFIGINPECTAFTLDTEEELNEKWKLIPDDIDILVSHSPIYGVLDIVDRESPKGRHRRSVGSVTLKEQLKKRIRPRLVVSGHIHESYGFVSIENTTFVNASHVNRKYEPKNAPIELFLMHNYTVKVDGLSFVMPSPMKENC